MILPRVCRTYSDGRKTGNPCPAGAAPDSRARKGCILIKKDYLTFADLKKRWNCESRDIHYLIADGDLVPSIIWNGRVIPCVWEPDLKESGGLILVSDKNTEYPEEITGVNGWLCLKLPSMRGPYDYSFSYAARELFARSEEFSRGTWFRLCNFLGDTETVEPAWIESHAAFMLETVEGCELILRPDLLEGNPSAQNNGTPAIIEKPFQPRERTTLLNTIAALLEIIAGEAPGVQKHPSFESEAKLIEAIAKHYQGYDGLSQSNLSRKFPEAKRSLQSR